MIAVSGENLALGRLELPPRAEGPLDSVSVGQVLRVAVGRRIDARHYEARLGTSTYRLESEVPLTPGMPVDARVAALGSPVELKLMTLPTPEIPRAEPASESTAELFPGANGLAQWAAQWQIPMNQVDLQKLGAMVARATDGQGVARAGLYLARLGQTLTDSTVRAIHEAIRPRVSESTESSASSVPMPLPVPLNLPAESPLALALQASLEGAAQRAHSDSGQGNPDGNAQDRQQWARRMLNVSDGGSVSYHYGTLPLLVAGQLVEIDVALFQDRPAVESTYHTHRLVMSLNTQRFGAVRIRVESVGAGLQVTLGSDAEAGTVALAQSEPQIRSMLAQLGWSNATVKFQTDSPLRPAADEVVQHVLLNGSVNRLW